MEEIQTNDDVFQLVDQQIANHYPTEIKIRRHSSKRSHDSNTDDATSLQPIVNAGGFRIHRLANEIRFPALQTAIAYTKGDIPIREIANATFYNPEYSSRYLSTPIRSSFSESTSSSLRTSSGMSYTSCSGEYSSSTTPSFIL